MVRAWWKQDSEKSESSWAQLKFGQEGGLASAAKFFTQVAALGQCTCPGALKFRCSGSILFFVYVQVLGLPFTRIPLYPL